MFQKDNDTPAAICLGIYLLGGLCYTVLLLIGYFRIRARL